MERLVSWLFFWKMVPSRRRRARGAKLWMFCPQWVTSNFHPGSTKNYNIPSSQQLFICAPPVLKLRKLWTRGMCIHIKTNTNKPTLRVLVARVRTVCVFSWIDSNAAKLHQWLNTDENHAITKCESLQSLRYIYTSRMTSVRYFI